MKHTMGGDYPLGQIVRDEEGSFDNPTNRPMRAPIIDQEGSFATGRPVQLPILDQDGSFAHGDTPVNSGYCGTK